MALTKNIIIVGPSGCGKSTLANLIATDYYLDCYSLDDYYLTVDPIYILGSDGEPYKTYERPYMYDGEALGEEVKVNNALIESFTDETPYAVVEGFLALQYQTVRDLPATRVYIDLPFSECLRRRKLRPRHEESDKAWEIIGEQETKEFVEPQKHLAGVHILDGMLSIEQLAIQIKNLIS